MSSKSQHKKDVKFWLPPPTPTLPSLTEIPIPDENIPPQRFTLNISIIQKANQRHKFNDFPEIAKLKGTLIWKMHTPWIILLQSLFVANSLFLEQIYHHVSRIGPEMVADLKAAIDNGIIGTKQNSTWGACIENLQRYNKYTAQFMLPISDDVFCGHFKIENLLTEENLSQRNKNDAKFLYNYVDKIKKIFLKSVRNVVDAMKPLKDVLDQLFNDSTVVLKKLHKAATQFPYKDDIVEITRQIADDVSGDVGAHILAEFNSFNNKLKPFLSIEDSLAEIISDCLGNGMCSKMKTTFDKVKAQLK